MGWPCEFKLYTEQNQPAVLNLGSDKRVRNGVVPFFEILNPSNALLRIAHHLPK
jgi:hypothetical protein